MGDDAELHAELERLREVCEHQEMENAQLRSELGKALERALAAEDRLDKHLTNTRMAALFLGGDDGGEWVALGVGA